MMRRSVVVVLGFAVASLALLVGAANPAGAQEETTAGGTIRDRSGAEDVLIEGVEILVESADGSFAEIGVTGPDGTWSVVLPGGGEYVATIDAATLPEGVELRDPDKTSLSFSLNEGRNRNLLFPLGDPVPTGGGDADGGTDVVDGSTGADDVAPGDVKVIQLLVDGIKLGLIIGMCAIGLSLVFGTTGLVNFAHGEFVTLGAVTAYAFNGWFDWKISLVFAGAIAVAVTAMAGGLFDGLVWSRLRKKGASLISMLVVSIGFSILFRYLILYRLGGRAHFYSDYRIQKRIDFGPFSLPPKDIFIIFFSLFVLLMVGLALQRTRIGKAMRAVADNRDLAESSGIDVQRVIRIVWIAGGGLAGLGGVLFGLTESIGWEMGFRLLLLMFAGTTLGGLGTAYGALLGCLVVGVFIQLSTLIIPSDTKNIGALLTLVLILLVRPQGLLGRKERIG
ncbi:MAG: branched-chain amino acid ABC transporter permease [Acidimicrobiales bacterium]